MSHLNDVITQLTTFATWLAVGNGWGAMVSRIVGGLIPGTSTSFWTLGATFEKAWATGDFYTVGLSTGQMGQQILDTKF
jgi:hypothetical protein